MKRITRPLLAIALPLLVSSASTAAGAPPAAPPRNKSVPIVDVPALQTTWKPADLAAACAKAESDTDARLKNVVETPTDRHTFASSFVAFDLAVADYNETTARLMFMKDIHPDAAVRDAGAACEERAGKYSVALSARKDLYVALKAVVDKGEATRDLDAEGKRLVDLTMLDFKRNGLELSDKDRAQLVKLRSRLTELASKYSKNLNEDKTSLTVKREDLVGLPEDFLASHEDKKKKGVFVLTTKYPDYYPIMENASKDATRKKMEVAFMNRGGKQNVKLLNEAVALRARVAKLLGYKTWVDYVAEDRMAKDASTVTSFLQRMRTGLMPGLQSDTAKMVALKAKDTGKTSPTIQAWDWRYYMNQIKKNDFAIDDEAVRAYFPADKVLGGMFQVYSTLFGITLNEVKGAPVWADGVKLYEIHDAGSGSLIAKFYVDLYPREGKYGHAAEFTMSAGHAVDGGYRIPMASLVVNFQPPAEGKVAHLAMDEVDTLFHEFGHVMHETLTTARYASQAGTHTALDFVEAPSQMLENWAYDPKVLALISQDPKDPSKPMPEELARKLNAARKYDAGVRYSRQVFLGTFDATIHTTDKANVDDVARKTWAEILKFPEDNGEHFAGTFGHMMGGYEGGYYGYLWSEVFAADMFTRFSKDGVLNPTTGRAYRDLVISRGRVVEPTVLLQDFLGRAPNEEAFLRGLGIAH